MKTNAPLMTPLQGLSSLQRPRFSPGLLLEDDDLTAGVDYTRELTQMMFRALFGCGVICGLEVKAWPTCNDTRVKITIGCGLALDCMGNPIQVPKPVTLEYDPDCEPLPPCIWVVLCYREACCRPRDTSCTDDDVTQFVQTRVQAGYEVKLYAHQPECACSCGLRKHERQGTKDPCCPGDDEGVEPERQEQEEDPECACYKAHYRGECGCECGCNCVVLARVDVAEEVGTDGSYEVREHGIVRRIRPVLRGYMDCFKWGGAPRTYQGTTDTHSPAKNRAESPGATVLGTPAAARSKRGGPSRPTSAPESGPEPAPGETPPAH